MALDSVVKEKISLEVIRILISAIDSTPQDIASNWDNPFFRAFSVKCVNKLEEKVSDALFFISLSSWLQGLNMTLGQTFFESIAHYLCEGKKREYTSKKLGNLQITQTQRYNIGSIIANLSNTINSPSLRDENAQLFQDFNTPLVNASDFSADVFFENADLIIAVELKSVKPNSGEMRGEKQKILEGKAALYRLFPSKRIYFYIGFPFNPTVNPVNNEDVTGYDKSRFLNTIINMNKYFAYEETLAASELWNFLSGTENTMEEILEIINTISTTEFITKFHLLIDNSKRSAPKYLEQLREWNFFF